MLTGIRRALNFAWKWRGGATGIKEDEFEIHRGDRTVPVTHCRPNYSRSPLPSWVVLHGVTRPGRHHPMLVRFVRSLAGTGSNVIIPEIPEWRELLLAPDEAARTIRAAVLQVGSMKEALPDRVGIMGFSLGVPQVLLAATDRALNPHLSGIAGFGGYGDLDRTMRFLFRGDHEWDGKDYHLDPDPYGRWIVVGNYLTMIPGFQEAGDVAGALLTLAKKAGDLQVGAWESCYDEVKKQLQSKVHPARRELFRAFAPPSGEYPPDDISNEMAPALAEAARMATPNSQPLSFLDRISVPVRLVHGRGDRLIPFSESLRLAEAFPAGTDVRVYLTGLFSHSQVDNSPGAGGGPEEQLNFLRMLSDLLSLV